MRSGETTRTSSEPGEAPAPPRLRLVSLADGVKAGGLLAMGLIAWLVPESRWSRVCRLLAHALMRVPHGGSGIDELIAGQGFSDGAASIYEASQAAALESLLQLLRDYRPGGWRPTVTVEGGEHLEEALERGHGAVLWLPLVTGYPFAAKVALYGAGFEVSHLSHPRHGFSETRLGARLLNPIQTRAEDRYLRSRIMLARGSSSEALRESLSRLRANEIVSITAGGAAQQRATVPFLNGELQIAGGAPALAHATDAALLFVLPLSEGGGVINVLIEPPVPRRSEETKKQFVERCARLFSARLEEFVRRHPHQWRSWRDLRPLH